MLDWCSRKWKMTEICFRPIKVIKRNVVSFCLKDFILSARFLNPRSGVLLDVQAFGMLFFVDWCIIADILKHRCVFETSGTVYKGTERNTDITWILIFSLISDYYQERYTLNRPRVRRRRPSCWDCGFESHRGHECLSFVSVVCCQVEVSETGRSLVQRSPTDGVCIHWEWPWNLNT